MGGEALEMGGESEAPFVDCAPGHVTEEADRGRKERREEGRKAGWRWTGEG